jgi:hypothetical protein
VLSIEKDTNTSPILRIDLGKADINKSPQDLAILRGIAV